MASHTVSIDNRPGRTTGPSVIAGGAPVRKTAAAPTVARFGAVSSAVSETHAVEAVKGVVLSACYFGITQAGLMTSFDGALFAVIAAVCLPQWRCYLLLMVLSVQDAPGQVIPYDYIAVAALGMLTLLGKAFSFSSRALSFDARQYRTLVFMALALVTYGIGISAVNSWFDFFEQSATRPYYVVGGLMGTMILSAYFSHQNICEDPFAVTRLRAVVICILVHIFMIAGLQSVYGPMFGASPQGAAAIVQLDQVMNPGERGLGRLRGPFLSPNTLAMVPLMYMLMLLRTRRSGTIPVSFIVGFFCAGISAAALGGARTMFVFYLAATAAMAWTRSPGKTLGVAVMAAPLLLLVRIPWDEILVIMRLNNLQSLGVRGRMWQVCVDSTSHFEWLFGVGLAHFPVLFGRLLGITVSDPHNWILSVGGMFGCFGLLFYMFMALRLLQRTVSSDKIEQVIAVSLVLFLLCRDLANTQYVLNNHPLCCLYWMSIGFAFTGPVKRISGASALPGRE